MKVFVDNGAVNTGLFDIRTTKNLRNACDMRTYGRDPKFKKFMQICVKLLMKAIRRKKVRHIY